MLCGTIQAQSLHLLKCSCEIGQGLKEGIIVKIDTVQEDSQLGILMIVNMVNFDKGSVRQLMHEDLFEQV